MIWAQSLKLYKKLLVEPLIIRQTMEEVTITVEEIKMVEKMHRMAMVVKIIDIIAETLAAVLEDVEHSIVLLMIGWQQQMCMIRIMFQTL